MKKTKKEAIVKEEVVKMTKKEVIVCRLLGVAWTLRFIEDDEQGKWFQTGLFKMSTKTLEGMLNRVRVFVNP